MYTKYKVDVFLFFGNIVSDNQLNNKCLNQIIINNPCYT